MFTHTTAANPVSHFTAWRAQKSYPAHAIVDVLVSVPRWRPSGLGYDFWQKVLGPLSEFGTTYTTVQACIDAGKAHGIAASMVQSHLKWFYTWGDQVEINGTRYVPTVATSVPAQAAIPISPIAPATAPVVPVKARAKAKAR